MRPKKHLRDVYRIVHVTGHYDRIPITGWTLCGARFNLGVHVNIDRMDAVPDELTCLVCIGKDDA